MADDVADDREPGGPMDVPARPTGRMRVDTLLVVLAGMAVTTLEFFPVSAAMPTISANLHLGGATATLVIAAFGVTYCAGLTVSGRIGARYGRRRVFAVGLGMLAATSAICAWASTPGVLIEGRFGQGVAAALVSPQIPVIVGRSFHGWQRARANAVLVAAIGAAVMFGQLLSGVLLRLGAAGCGWRAVFGATVPVALLALVAVRRAVPPNRGHVESRPDLVGMVLLAASLLAVVLSLAAGAQLGWPAWTLPLPLLAIPPLLGFVGVQRAHQRRGRTPTIPVGLLRQRAVLAGTAITFVCSGTAAALVLEVVFYVQGRHGLSPIGSGLVLVPFGTGFLLAATRAPALARRLGRDLLSLAMIVLALGHVVLAFTVDAIGDDGSPAWLVAGLLVVGAAIGTVASQLAPIILAGMAAQRPRRASADDQSGGRQGDRRGDRGRGRLQRHRRKANWNTRAGSPALPRGPRGLCGRGRRNCAVSAGQDTAPAGRPTVKRSSPSYRR